MNKMNTTAVSRRDVLLTATSAAAGFALAADPPASQPAKPLLPTGRLGRTKYPVTLISFGTVWLRERRDVRLVRQIIDSGVNLVHTSKSYNNGNSIEIIAEAFKADRSCRERVLLCFKSFRPQEESEIDEMLAILGIDYVDLLLPELHKAKPEDLERIQKAQDNLKKKGKIRYTGFVCHGEPPAVTDMVLEKAPTYFDAALLGMMPAMPGEQPKEGDADIRKHYLENLGKLRKNGVGILAMKSGARQAVSKGYKVFGPLAKTVLELGVDTVVTSITTRDELEMIKKLDFSDLKLSPEEQKAAQAFFQSRQSTCRMCGQCGKACPQGLPVNDLMRVRMYHDEYGWPEHAQAEFQLLGLRPEQWSSQCGDCSICSKVCPVGMAHTREIRRVTSLFV